MPGMAICLSGADGDPMKTIACIENFVKCAKDKCLHEEVPEVPTVDVTAIANNDAWEKMKQVGARFFYKQRFYKQH